MPPMRYRTFGRTGLQVSELSLGMIGGDPSGLGLGAHDEPRRPERTAMVALLLRAFERGVNLVDASLARASGGEESLVVALGEWGEAVHVATTVGRVAQGQAPRQFVREAIETSLRRLGREQLDVVLLDELTARELERGEPVEVLVEARQRGLVGSIGAVVSSPDDAVAAVHHEAISVVQVAFNLLDQRAMAAVFPESEACGTALWARSALLEGVLTERRHDLPERLAALRDAAERAARWARKNGDELMVGALRFCMAHREIGSVVVGVRTEDELDGALAAAEAELLHSHRLANADRLAIRDEALLDPARWGIA